MPLQFLSPIHRASRQIALYLEPSTEQRGVSTPESHLLVYLRSYGPCPIGELHRVFGLRRSTLTSMLDRLEERALIARRPHPRDRRSVLVSLSRSGRRLAERIQLDLEALEIKIRRGLPQRAVQGFEQVMDAIREATQIEVRERSLQ
jgi:DNA-binding MarR family transcriptional regulator